MERFAAVGAVVALGVLSAVLAVIGSFLSPAVAHPFGIAVPLGIVLAVAGNLILGVGGAWAADSRLVPAVTVGVWTVVVLIFGSNGPGKDTVVTGNGRGVVFLVLGVVSGAIAVGIVTSPRWGTLHPLGRRAEEAERDRDPV